MAYSQPFPLAAPPPKAMQQPMFGPDLAVRLICPDCKDPNPNIVEQFGSGDIVCGNCGMVLGDRIVDTRSEWRVSLPALLLHFVARILCISTSIRRSPTTKAMILLVSAQRLIL
jgi:TFIIB zinc-binding